MRPATGRLGVGELVASRRGECSRSDEGEHVAEPGGHPFLDSPGLLRSCQETGKAMEYFDLGNYTRVVTTTSDEAQTWFDRGLRWTYGYNHEEAVECFRKAIAADPACGMAYWGLAYAIGPNYNKPWDLFEPEEKAAALTEANTALKTARALPGLSPVEAAMIRALAARDPTDPEIEDFGPWNDAFTDAMRPVYETHPDDLDAVAVFAEAGMNRTPWLLWDLLARMPAVGASTDEARAALERAFADTPGAWDHPGLLHLYIHLMEMSPWPELALSHGDRLCEIVPDSGHLQHMATHIDVLCGDYHNVITRNQREHWSIASSRTTQAARTSTPSIGSTTSTSRHTERCSSAASRRRSPQRTS